MKMPIIQLMLDRVEADDIISMVVSNTRYKGWQKVIVSSDKDFLQLLDEETVSLPANPEESLDQEDGDRRIRYYA